MPFTCGQGSPPIQQASVESSTELLQKVQLLERQKARPAFSEGKPLFCGRSQQDTGQE